MNDPQQQIDQLDESLRLLREAWEDAKLDDKAKWTTKIDAALDKRLVLMRQRDSGKEQPV